MVVLAPPGGEVPQRWLRWMPIQQNRSMILFRVVLVSLLLPIWAVFTLGLVVMASTTETVLTDDQLVAIGLGGNRLDRLDNVAIVVLLVGLAVHGFVWLITSRSTAAMAGSIGGLLGAGLAGLAAVGLAAAPTSERVEVYRLLVHPGAAGILAVVAVLLGFRAWLAHTGRWRYRVVSHDASMDDWGDGWGDGD
jgi:hypothetical protein